MLKKQPPSSSSSPPPQKKTSRRTKKAHKSLYKSISLTLSLRILNLTKPFKILAKTLVRARAHLRSPQRGFLRFNHLTKVKWAGWVLVSLSLAYGSVFFISQKWNFYALELVKVIGTEKLHPYDLLKELNLKKGISLLTLHSASLEQKLLQRPQIAKAKVTKVYPATLKILIEEKQVAFLIKTPAQIYAITQLGEVLFTGNEIEQHHYFIIEIETNLEQASLQEHEGLSAFLSYFNQLDTQEQDVEQLFSGIYFGEEVLLFAKNEPVTLNLGKELSLEKLRKARYAYLYKKQKNIQKSQIDLRFNFVRFTT